jgi:spoIIIJ-associated protein
MRDNVPRPGPSVEGEGETIDDALDEALTSLGISRDEAEVEVVQEARRGLFGLGAQRARVRVSPRTVPAAMERPVAEPVGVSALGTGSVAEDAVQLLQRLVELMGFRARIDSTGGEERGEVCLQISSDARGLLIGRHGQTLDALEHLVTRLVSRRDEGFSRIVLDAEGYRERRRRELVDTAHRLAAHVRKTGRAEAMDPLNARERRIVHLTLASDATVSTRSAGEGALRHVVISPESLLHDGRAERPRSGSKGPVGS